MKSTSISQRRTQSGVRMLALCFHMHRISQSNSSPCNTPGLFSGGKNGEGGRVDLKALSQLCQFSWFWQEALERSRPDFISRSQDRVRELERRAQERREQAGCVDPQSDAALRQRRGCSSRSPSLTGTVPATLLTSHTHYAAHCPSAAAVAACHKHNPTHTQT